MNIRDSHSKTQCDNCKSETHYTGPEIWRRLNGENKYVSVHNGFCLDLSGHYGGFNDDLAGRRSVIALCHECSVAIARVLPGIFPVGEGFHSMFSDETQESCCEFAWDSINGVVHVGDGKGGWVPREGN